MVNWDRNGDERCAKSSCQAWKSKIVFIKIFWLVSDENMYCLAKTLWANREMKYQNQIFMQSIGLVELLSFCIQYYKALFL